MAVKKDLLGLPMDGRRRKTSEARSKFERWVLKSGGTSTIAKLIGVSQPTVVNWCYRRRIPGLESAILMVEVSKGKLTYRDILKGTKPL